jgi:transcriptional regulator with XRE-family HTH domain
MARINKLIGKKIREIRTQIGISQEELSFKAGMHRTYIGQIERGEKNLGLINLEKIARALNVKIPSLFE